MPFLLLLTEDASGTGLDLTVFALAVRLALV